MHFHKTLVFFLVIMISLAIAVILFLVAGKFCIVTKIELNKDFNVDTAKLYQFLDIQEGRFIWEYNANRMQEKLSTQAYLDECDVKVKWPNSIYIYMKIRVPIARIIDPDDNVCFVDKNGLVFKESNYSGRLPLIIVNKKSSIFVEKKLNTMYAKLVGVLSDLKNRYPLIYNGISQIDIVEYGKQNVHYIVSYAGMNKKIYLKNQINVDLIREGLVASMFLDGSGSAINTAFYSGIGFVY